MADRDCWCGSHNLCGFSPEYARCSVCGTLVALAGLSDEALQVKNDDTDFYGKQYWLEHQSKDLGHPDIFGRAREDLIERNLHWLRTLKAYKLPGSKVLELGCSHGSFVAMLRQAGYDASGMEMSPWVVNFAKETFDIPVFVGPVETTELPNGSFDVVALMDVLEHLPDPIGTMRHALNLLNPDGILLIQTPRFREEMNYETLINTNATFLAQLKSDEHLYLFTEDSVSNLFKRLGADYIRFEQPIFHQYDMFFVVSRQPIEPITDPKEGSLLTPKGRFVQGLLDQDRKIKELEEHIKVIDSDRAARLEQILELTKMINEQRS
ncbi:class I SAM-dependent methyltransferase [Tardiphaga sp. 215_C5_N2_1]|jgi:2-polyprenyl-3-methyl-5-hydroxy-6-metoxy-1,4-benzoquinol methylase|uniref:class I SAM-dependent methyltransferase n=1 Tax=Tardiphaga sp. 215_C5_N2_1 TaxID=3240774 RepID=UPI003F896E95